MNNTFSFRRFSLLFSKHTTEYYKTYLLSVAVLLGLLTAILGFSSYVSGGPIHEKAQLAIFWVFLLGAGSIFTSMIFSDFGDKRKSISMLTLPVSHFEKYLVAWLYSFVIFQLVFVLSFYAVDFIVLLIGNSGKSQGLKILNVFSAEENYRLVFLFYAILHSLAFLGAIFFEKIHFIKTAFVVLLLCLLAVLINQPIADALFDAKLAKVVPFVSLGVEEGGRYYLIRPLPSIEPVMFGLSLSCIALLWIGAYFKLKEKEV
ncbi:hypothetical protein SAMN05421820_113207 [Pedobacter steynii]|uniref:ABC-2 family transporter protein n=1 Tax=Pedobacter steynii TaxID=430522 RepID=A0A1H0IMP1_9SPHI|nr:hypothetical protein [Pedobacter steynii]NQX42953.1 hypothetical protein [Pedobacter steynii]SDO32663.1 hypothetical protein SAMN05421820_113207 [Pedobacter steynii]